MVFTVIDGEREARGQGGGGGALKEGSGVSEEACFLLKEPQEWSPRDQEGPVRLRNGPGASGSRCRERGRG